MFLLSLPEAMDVDDCGVHVSHMDYLVQKRNILAVVFLLSLPENMFNICFIIVLDVSNRGIHIFSHGSPEGEGGGGGPD